MYPFHFESSFCCITNAIVSKLLLFYERLYYYQGVAKINGKGAVYA